MKKSLLYFSCLCICFCSTIQILAQEVEYDPLKDSNPQAVELWKKYVELEYNWEKKELANKYLMERADLDTANLQYQKDVLKHYRMVSIIEYQEIDGKRVRVNNYDPTPDPYFNRAIRMTEAKYGAISDELFECYEELGNCLSFYFNEKSIEAYKKALAIHQQQKKGAKSQDRIPRVLSNISRCYYELRIYPEAIKYIDQAIQKGKKERQLAEFYVDKGNCHLLAKQPDKAIKAYEYCLTTKEKSKRSWGPAPSFNFLSKAYEQVGNIDKAILWKERELTENEANYLDRQSSWRKESIIHSCLELVDLYKQIENTDIAILYGRKAMGYLKSNTEDNIRLYDQYVQYLFKYAQLECKKGWKGDEVLKWIMEYAEDKETNEYRKYEMLYMTYALMAYNGGFNEFTDILSSENEKGVITVIESSSRVELSNEKEFQKAVSLKPDRSEAYELKGLCILESKLSAVSKEALALWERVQQLQPDKQKLRESDFYKALLKKKLIKKIK